MPPRVLILLKGGAIICHDEKTKKRLDYLKNFGFENEVTVVTPGINAKMNEIQAAYGLLQLKTFENQVNKRKKITKQYRSELNEVSGIRFFEDAENVKHNYSYFPIFIDKNYPLSRDDLYFKLKENNIFSRRFFYPLISQFSMYSGLPSANSLNLPVAENTSKQVICLPIYSELDSASVNRVIRIIKN